MAKSTSHERTPIFGLNLVPNQGKLRQFITEHPWFRRINETTDTSIRSAELAIDNDLVIQAMPNPLDRLYALVFYTAQHVLHDKTRRGKDPQDEIKDAYGFPPGVQDDAAEAAKIFVIGRPWRVFLDVTRAFQAKFAEHEQEEANRLAYARYQEDLRRVEAMNERARAREQEQQLIRSFVFPTATPEQQNRRTKLIALCRTPEGANLTTLQLAKRMGVSVPTITLDRRAIDSAYPGAIPPRLQGRREGFRPETVELADVIVETIGRLEAEHGPWKYASTTYQMVADELERSVPTIKNIAIDQLNLPSQAPHDVRTTMMSDIKAMRNGDKLDDQQIFEILTNRDHVTPRQAKMTIEASYRE